eukprot:1182048-Prorocentrum_minimum.AAC.4
MATGAMSQNPLTPLHVLVQPDFRPVVGVEALRASWRSKAPWSSSKTSPSAAVRLGTSAPSPPARSPRTGTSATTRSSLPDGSPFGRALLLTNPNNSANPVIASRYIIILQEVTDSPFHTSYTPALRVNTPPSADRSLPGPGPLLPLPPSGGFLTEPLQGCQPLKNPYPSSIRKGSPEPH